MYVMLCFGNIFMHCHDSINILFSSLESFYPCCTLALILFLTASFFLDFIDTLIIYFVKIVKPLSLDLSIITCQLLLVVLVKGHHQCYIRQHVSGLL